jgi:hypothetical protein
MIKSYKGPVTALFGVDSVISAYRNQSKKIDAGWSSPVARQAHNLKVVGSNPTPATKKYPVNSIS